MTYLMNYDVATWDIWMLCIVWLYKPKTRPSHCWNLISCTKLSITIVSVMNNANGGFLSDLLYVGRKLVRDCYEQ